MNQAEFVINPVTPQPTSSAGHMLTSLSSFQEKHFSFRKSITDVLPIYFPAIKGAINAINNILMYNYN